MTLNRSATDFFSPRALTEVTVRNPMGRYLCRDLMSVWNTNKPDGFIANVDPSNIIRIPGKNPTAFGGTFESFNVDTSKGPNFNVKKYGWEYPNPIEYFASADEEFQEAVRGGAALVFERLAIGREARFIDFLDATFTPVNVAVSTPATDTPILTIKNLIGTISLTAPEPNVIGMSLRDCIRILETNDAKTRSIQTVQPRAQEGTDPDKNAQLLSDLLGIRVVLSRNDAVNTASVGETPSMSSLWSGKAFLTRVEPKTRMSQATSALIEWNATGAELANADRPNYEVSGNGAGGLMNGFTLWMDFDKAREAHIVRGKVYDDMLSIKGAANGRYIAFT